MSSDAKNLAVEIANKGMSNDVIREVLALYGLKASISDDMDATLRLCRKSSDVTGDLITQILQRDEFGRKKYGTTLDRTDLTHSEWLQHMAEELMDAAGYALAAKRKLETKPAPGPGVFYLVTTNAFGDVVQPVTADKVLIMGKRNFTVTYDEVNDAVAVSND